jgi:DNA-directed RNA polymerase subunit RPC12/RpoP
MNARTIDPDTRYFCPMCGIELALFSFETPERDYYCPSCATRTTPSAVAVP